MWKRRQNRESKNSIQNTGKDGWKSVDESEEYVSSQQWEIWLFCNIELETCHAVWKVGRADAQNIQSIFNFVRLPISHILYLFDNFIQIQTAIQE